MHIVTLIVWVMIATDVSTFHSYNMRNDEDCIYNASNMMHELALMPGIMGYEVRCISSNIEPRKDSAG